MTIVALYLGFLLVVSLVCGFVGSGEMVFALEINTLKSPFYKIGLYSQRYPLEDGSSEDEITIGLFFVNVVITFWKPND